MIIGYILSQHAWQINLVRNMFCHYKNRTKSSFELILDLHGHRKNKNLKELLAVNMSYRKSMPTWMTQHMLGCSNYKHCGLFFYCYGTSIMQGSFKPCTTLHQVLLHMELTESLKTWIFKHRHIFSKIRVRYLLYTPSLSIIHHPSSIIHHPSSIIHHHIPLFVGLEISLCSLSSILI